MLAGKRCVVTGASRGIGEAIAVAYAKEGATLLLVSRGEEALEKVAEKCRAAGSPSCDVLAADLTLQSEAERVANVHASHGDCSQRSPVLQHAMEKYGTVDVLVNNAGKGTDHGFAGCLGSVPAQWTKILQLNLMTAMTLSHAVAPKMVEQRNGCIINMGSRACVVPMGAVGAYCATKFGLRGWSLSCHDELRAHNVKVCLICPGYVGTQLIEPFFSEEDMKEMMSVEDVAEAAMMPFKTSAKCVPSEIHLYETTTPIPQPRKNQQASDA